MYLENLGIWVGFGEAMTLKTHLYCVGLVDFLVFLTFSLKCVFDIGAYCRILPIACCLCPFAFAYAHGMGRAHAPPHVLGLLRPPRPLCGRPPRPLCGRPRGPRTWGGPWARPMARACANRMGIGNSQ